MAVRYIKSSTLQGTLLSESTYPFEARGKRQEARYKEDLDQMTENSCESKRTRLGLKVRKGKDD